MPNQYPITTEDLKQALAAFRKAGGNASEAAAKLGIPRTTLRHRLKLAARMRLVGPGEMDREAAKELAEDDQDETVELPRQAARAVKSREEAEEQGHAEALEDARARLKARRQHAEHNAMLKASQEEVKQLERRVEELEEQRDILLALDAHTRSGPIPHYTASRGNAIPVLVLSDLHMEERVDADQVAGCDNQYNPDIAKARLTKAFQHGLFMINTLRNMAKIDTMCLAMLGDIITGGIHDELAETNYMTAIEATQFASEELGSGIEYLLSRGDFQKIIVPCSFGNHGRSTDKSRAKDGAENSYEWLLYNMLAKSFRGEKRLEWRIATGYHNYVKLWDTTLRFHHGDAISYGGGVGGVTIPIRKAIANWNTVAPADVDVMGHFHQMTDGGDFIVNGSLIGYNEYSLRIKARFERPRQTLFLVDKERGKTLTSEVFVD